MRVEYKGTHNFVETFYLLYFIKKDIISFAVGQLQRYCIVEFFGISDMREGEIFEVDAYNVGFRIAMSDFPGNCF